MPFRDFRSRRGGDRIWQSLESFVEDLMTRIQRYAEYNDTGFIGHGEYNDAEFVEKRHENYNDAGFVENRE